MKVILINIFILFSTSLFGQGGIDHIKSQPYLQMDIDCSCVADSCATSIRDRFCANLSFQRMDSLLTITYDSLLTLIHDFSSFETTSDSLSYSFVKLQKEWRNYRSQHCGIFWKDSDCINCATNYLSCMENITELRLFDLKRLLNYYRNQVESYKHTGVPIKLD